MTEQDDRAPFDVVGETAVTGPKGDPYPSPTVANVKRHAGIAGQFAMTCEVTYPDEPTRRVTFTGSTYGGPVVGQFGDGPQTFITDPGRFGNFADDPAGWVRRYFA